MGAPTTATQKAPAKDLASHQAKQSSGRTSANPVSFTSQSDIGSFAGASRLQRTAGNQATSQMLDAAQGSPAPAGEAALLQRASNGGPKGASEPIAAGDRISPGEVLDRVRRLLKSRTTAGREAVRDFNKTREDAYWTGVISDALGSISHNVNPATLGAYDHVDAMVDDAVDAGRRLHWPACGRLLSDAAAELQRLERKMVEAREGGETGAERAVDLLHMVQGLCALLAAAPIGAAAGSAVAVKGAVAAGIFSRVGLATASATGGVMAGYGMLNETAEQLAMRGSIDLAAVAQRGVIEFVGTFFGHFANGVLAKALGDWLGRFVNRELVASGLPARALGEGERFAVEILSGALATPFTTALGVVTARLVGNASWPTPKQFVDQVMLEIPKGVLMSVLMQGAPQPTPAAANRRAAGEGSLPRSPRVEFKPPELPGYKPPAYTPIRPPGAPPGEMAPPANDPSSIPLASQQKTRESEKVDLINSEKAKTVEMPHVEADPSRAKTFEMPVPGEVPFAEFQARFVEMYKIPAPPAESIVRHTTEGSFAAALRQTGLGDASTEGYLAFYNPTSHVIHLRPGSSLGTILHEGLHFIQPRGKYGKAAADAQVGRFVDEGLTEMFAEFGAGTRDEGVYEANIKLCDKMVDAVGMDALHEAYLHGTWHVVEARFLIYFKGDKAINNEFFTLLRSMDPDNPKRATLQRVELLLRRYAADDPEAVTTKDFPAVKP